MSQELVQLAQSVYGEGVRVMTQKVGEQAGAAAVVHPSGQPLVLVIGASEEQALKAVGAALNALKG